MARRSLLFLVGDPAAASVRFRVRQFLPALAAAGFDVTVMSVAVPLVERLRRLRGAARYDHVVVHRLLLAAPEAWLLARAAPDHVFDFDDALWVRDSAHARQRSWQRRGRMIRMLRGARGATAGSRHLAAWARLHHPGVTIVPTAVDLAPFAKVEPAREPVIGWIGTRSTLMYLRPVLPVLGELARERPGLRLEVVCDAPLESGELPIVHRPWALEREPADLARFAIGIMPLADDPWTRGKCGGKLLQYFAARLPVVCSPVGANRDLVEAGVSGLFACGRDEWGSALRALLDDAALRRRFGAAGRARVERDYSIEAVLPKLLAALG